MRSVFVKATLLTGLTINAAHANYVNGSYFCINQNRQLTAEFDVRNTRDRQSYTNCCDESGCLQEDPAGRCLSQLERISDVAIKFYPDVLPRSISTEFILQSGYDRFFRLWLFGSGNVGNSTDVLFYMRGAYPDSHTPNSRFEHWLIVENRANGNYTKSQCMRKNTAKYMKYVYKIFTLSQWMSFQDKGEFVGSSDDIRDGFIHLASNEQVESIIDKYFSSEKLVYVAEFLTSEVSEDLKWESSGSDIYPHLYKVSLKVQGVKNFRIIKPTKG